MNLGSFTTKKNFIKKKSSYKGRELERIYVENGVIDKMENVSDNECFTNEANDYSEGVIGHMEDTDGTHVVDLVFDSSKKRTFRLGVIETNVSKIETKFEFTFFFSSIRRTFESKKEIYL